jgi:two-component system, NtrC family, sensor kinase
LFRRSIRTKLWTASSLLVLLILILAGVTLYAAYSFRGFTKYMSRRAEELPVAARLSRDIGSMRTTIGELRGFRARAFPSYTEQIQDPWWVQSQFPLLLSDAQSTLTEYRRLLGLSISQSGNPSAHEKELETVREIDARLQVIRELIQDQDWSSDGLKLDELNITLIELETLTARIPADLHSKLAGATHDVESKYRALIVLMWSAGLSTLLLFFASARLFYTWVLQPLQVLIDGSRHIAGGRFDYRIHLDTRDEMTELAIALNGMTSRFQTIRDDLDRQVVERTRQAIRSEQLASVGFLAAGVAHEINNPLASIALCAESLEMRLGDAFPKDAPQTPSKSGDVNPADDPESLFTEYLGMIQEEAFRCKEITEKLLDFSRVGGAQREPTLLTDVVQDMVDMTTRLGKYQGRLVEFEQENVDRPIVVLINVREIKQVVLNLLTNALESLDDEGGRVRIRLAQDADEALLTFEDNGCGMDDETLPHVFEPFFTQRRRGQGTGLGLSISHKIVANHGGRLEAESKGAGQGALFRLTLPLNEESADKQHDDASSETIPFTKGTNRYVA